ncbi:GerMN domain-containing protein [Paenibacillus cymbidii]|uniref:GerMN domain-containing protein n=1 Tax=Paenibacillus cymbidii TaxID=1639034 RepID=UPI0010805524|nr:GerMN domain-containing protein [Paenibacillus cymbidii]
MRKNLTKTACAVLVAAVCLTAAAGCGTDKQTKRGAEASSSPVATTAPSPAQASPQASPSPQLTSKSIRVYYGDLDAMKLVEQETTIRYGADAAKYEAAFNALRQSPDSKQVALLAGVALLSAKAESGNLTLDVKVEDTGRLGAPGEQLLLDALRKTMFQFEELKTFDVLVGGKKTESLMGHMDLPHPFAR